MVDKVALGQVFLQILWFSTARIMGYVMAQLVEALCYKLEGCGFISSMVSLEIFIDTLLLAALWPWS